MSIIETKALKNLAEEITAALPAGFRAKVWTRKRESRIYVDHLGKNHCVYHVEKGGFFREGKDFGLYDENGFFRPGIENDLGATQIAEAGWKIRRYP